MSNYVVFDGDTFDSVSRKVYGFETNSNLIRRANPGIEEPLRHSTVLNIPVDPNAPQDVRQGLISNNPAQVSVSITGFESFNSTPQLGSNFDEAVKRTRVFNFWTSVTINRSIDNLSTLSLMAPFESDSEEMREFFRPFTYNEITLAIGGNVFFVGTIMGITPIVGENGTSIEMTAYSTPGIMNDCQQPKGDYPLSWENYTLKELAEYVSAAFGVRVQFDADSGDVFETVTAKPESTALSFLRELAKQRGLVIGDTRDGFLLFQKSVDTGFPVARVVDGDSPLVTIAPTFNTQQAYTTVTGLSPTSPGDIGSSFTVHTGILGGRFHTYMVKDTLGTSLEVAVNAKVGRMYGNMVTYSVKMPTWFDAHGSLWSPNTTMTLLAPNAMIYTEYEFIIRSVKFVQTGDVESATLELVLPGAFSSKIPAVLPWE